MQSGVVVFSSIHALTMSCRAFVDGDRYALSTWQRLPPKGKERELPLHKAPVLIPPSNHKGRNVDSMFFPLKCNSSPPFFAPPITVELFCLCGQLPDASARPPPQNQSCTLYQLGFFFFFNLHALKNNPKLLITAALFAPFA